MDEHRKAKNKGNQDAVTLQAEQDLARVRELLVEPAISKYKTEQQAQFSTEVSQVLSEAIGTREQTDKSISAALNPIINRSVKSAFVHQKQELTGFIFPLVGDLVRKFVAASLREFLEKTNQIIENSVSVKGLSWRFKAWRSGLTFAQYAASQTYLYRVEQVLLIHKETGLLINSVSLDERANQRSDLISAMLTAINDFVSDSFSVNSDKEQYLDEIKTDDSTLYLFQGPLVMLVASVTGNISPEAKAHLQQTMEGIHKTYTPQLKAYNGDATELMATSEELSQCLLAQERSPRKKHKRPIFAFLVLTLFAVAMGWYIFGHWQTNQAVKRIIALPIAEGIVPLNVNKQGLYDIELAFLRADNAISLDEYLAMAQVDKKWLTVTSYPYAPTLQDDVRSSIDFILQNFPELSYNEASSAVSGTLDANQYSQLRLLLEQIKTKYGIEFDTSNISIAELTEAQTREGKRLALTQLASKVELIKIDFALNASQVDASQAAKIELIATLFNSINELSASLNEKSLLLIVGSTDDTGVNAANIALAERRAQAVEAKLLELGMPANTILTTAVLPIKTSNSGADVRKAFLNVVTSSQPNNAGN
ncbi:OmpA family protein [Glaciecola siphonariae]|uniref:OmpA family protein n=1 Tax=Glaciecola siphonariae TaxID=521012 RepID=A0ABV9LWJ1_9ALTE